VVAFVSNSTKKDLTAGVLHEKPLFFVPRASPQPSLVADPKTNVHPRWWPGEEPPANQPPKA
jgi:hypothetical protein